MLLNESVSEQVVQNPEADRPNVSITDLLGTVRLDKSNSREWQVWYCNGLPTFCIFRKLL